MYTNEQFFKNPSYDPKFLAFQQDLKDAGISTPDEIELNILRVTFEYLQHTQEKDVDLISVRDFLDQDIESIFSALSNYEPASSLFIHLFNLYKTQPVTHNDYYIRNSNSYVHSLIFFKEQNWVSPKIIEG